MSGDHGKHDPEPEPYPALRAKALESLLIEKGLIDSGAIDEIVRTYEQDIGPLNGAEVVARAWSDPEYKKRLLANGTEAISEMGFQGAQGAEIVVLENTPQLHNMVVCTLCSCYPWPILGLPPTCCHASRPGMKPPQPYVRQTLARGPCLPSPSSPSPIITANIHP